MSLLKRFLVRRREKAEDLAAIAKSRQEMTREGDEPEKSQADIVGETYDTFPS